MKFSPAQSPVTARPEADKAPAPPPPRIDAYNQEGLSLLANNRDRLETIEAALLEHETLDDAHVYAAAGIALRPAAPDATPGQPIGIAALAQSRRDAQTKSSQQSPKALITGLDRDQESPHEAGFGCTPAGPNGWMWRSRDR